MPGVPRPRAPFRDRRASLAAVLVGAALVAAALVAGCGGEIEVDDESDRAAAELFNERCSGCHSLEAANAYGSKPAGQVQAGERTDGPDFNTRTEQADDVLFAIRNGGFSGAIMPANIVLGEDAQRLADFVAEYSGSDG